jgi:hypothetical protein
MQNQVACQSPSHLVSRRTLLQNMLAGAAGVGAVSQLIHPARATELESKKKQLLIVLLNGGLSQFESFDPKPKTDTGGPFRTIPTSVPGTHFCELLPYTAKQAHRLAVVRSVYAEKVPNSHAGARDYVETGRSPALGPYPLLGPVCSKLLGGAGELPGNIHITPSRSGPRQDAAFLGPQHASLMLSNGQPPRDVERPATFEAASDAARYRLRSLADLRFSQQRRTAYSEAYNASYEQAMQLIRRKDLFDVAQEPQRDQEAYGTHDFGRHCLLARRLLTAGVTCVKITHSNYDSHMENFNFHLEQLGEFDRPFATLLEDFAQRGMLEHTLVVLMTEFGRTPQIQPDLGRDHWPDNWSVALAGCGIQAGALLGKTNDNGTKIVDRPVHAADLFHTYLKALGLQSDATHQVGGQQIPVAPPGRAVVNELLS